MERPIKVLNRLFGYKEFRNGQFEIINNILKKRDSFCIMPTGGGKSICYQIPAFIFDGITIVISPLIALMKDQVDNINNIGIKAKYINSTNTLDEVKEIRRKRLEESTERGNAPDDLKSAGNDICTDLKKLFKLKQCGNNGEYIMRDTISKIITEDMEVYQSIERDIFG